MRYVETCSLTTCNAFALAVSFGKGKPAKGPFSSVVYTGSGSSSTRGELSPDSSSSELATGAVPGEGESSTRPLPSGSLLGHGGGFGTGFEASGKSFVSIRVMAARCEPASTAKTEFLAHLAAVDRTRKPVTLSSFGPPPEPYKVSNCVRFFRGISRRKRRTGMYAMFRHPTNIPQHKPQISGEKQRTRQITCKACSLACADARRDCPCASACFIPAALLVYTNVDTLRSWECWSSAMSQPYPRNANLDAWQTSSPDATITHKE